MLPRKMLCNNHSVNVVKIDEKVFDKAQVDSVIIGSFKPIDINYQYKAFKLFEENFSLISTAPIEQILNEKESIFRIEINTEYDTLISKIEKDTFKLNVIGEVRDGIVAGEIKDLLYSPTQLNSDCHKLYFGKHLSRYHLNDSDVWVNYKPDEMMNAEINRKGIKRPGLWMRDEKIFNREKILTRFVAKEIIGTYDDDFKYYEHTLHSTYIKDNRFGVKYVLGLLNSNLFKFYYKNTNSQGGDIFPQVRISSVENLPIKLAEKSEQEKIEKLVTQIISVKKHNHTIDTSNLEQQVDKLVYQLYGITEEERGVIEGV